MYSFESLDVEVRLEQPFARGKISRLKWCVEFEMRSYGIKSRSVFLPEQTVEAIYEMDDEEGDLRVVYEEIKIFPETTKVIVESGSEYLFPDHVEILKDRSIEVYF